MGEKERFGRGRVARERESDDGDEGLERGKVIGEGRGGCGTFGRFGHWLDLNFYYYCYYFGLEALFWAWALTNSLVYI